MFVSVYVCVCVCFFVCLFEVQIVEKCFREAALLSLLPPGWFPPSCTRASHTAKINEAKFQMTMDSFGQYQKVQKCDSDISFVQVIVCKNYPLQKRGQMRNLMVLRCSMVHFKSYHRLARLPHKWHTCNLVWGHVPIGVLAVHNHLIASALTQ